MLSNPQNQADYNDLISKDLMEKLHTFLAHIYMTIGQVQNRTWLPLPPNDGASGEKSQSSKDKAHVLEGSLLRPRFKLNRRHYYLDEANKERAEAGP